MNFGLFEMIAFFSIVLAFAVYELVTVRRALREGDDSAHCPRRAKENT